MGIFDNLTIADDIDLPEWEYDDDPSWQTKDIERPAMRHYRITSDDRLEKRQDIYRDKTDEEKQDEAEEYGFDSWSEMQDAVDGAMASEDSITAVNDLFPEDATVGLAGPSDEVLDEKRWADQDYHGTFEFHTSIRQNPQTYDTVLGEDGDDPIKAPREFETHEYWSFEAIFTKGDLDSIELNYINDLNDD